MALPRVPKREGEDDDDHVLFDHHAEHDRDDEQLAFVFDRGVQRQADEQREQRIGVEVLHVARAQRGVEQVRDGQDARERLADSLQTHEIDRDRAGREGAGLHGQQGRRTGEHPIQRGEEQQDERRVVGEDVPARDRDEWVLEPGEQPRALVEDADIERRGPVAVVDLDGQVAVVDEVSEDARRDDEVRPVDGEPVEGRDERLESPTRAGPEIGPGFVALVVGGFVGGGGVLAVLAGFETWEVGLHLVDAARGRFRGLLIAHFPAARGVAKSPRHGREGYLTRSRSREEPTRRRRRSPPG